MATRKRANTGLWRALRGFGYPADAEVRSRIRQGEKVTMEERGENVEVAKGQTFQAGDLPADVRDSCLQYAEPVKKKKGAATDA